MKRKEFNAAAAQARKEGRESQIKLARNAASDFLQNPASFNPMRLMSLDRDGVREMLQMVEAADAARLVAISAPQKVGDGTLGESGWANLRGPEPHYWIRGITVGAAAGACIVIIIGLASALLG